MVLYSIPPGRFHKSAFRRHPMKSQGICGRVFLNHPGISGERSGRRKRKAVLFRRFKAEAFHGKHGGGCRNIRRGQLHQQLRVLTITFFSKSLPWSQTCSDWESGHRNTILRDLKSSMEFASARLTLFSPTLAETLDGFCVTLMRNSVAFFFWKPLKSPTAG